MSSEVVQRVSAQCRRERTAWHTQWRSRLVGLGDGMTEREREETRPRGRGVYGTVYSTASAPAR
jgi:hypothetical protein